jgi:signal transduction histidine kinase
MTDRLDPVQRPSRVLIAEDDPAAANVLQTLLGRVGYEVIVVPDGASVLQTLEDGPSPDVLLLDWMLPEISGLEVCYRVRAKWDPLTLPILMVTAKTDAESISAAFDAGASDYLTKPFLGAELRARIAAHLRVKQLLEERMRFEEHLKEREKLSTLGLLVSGVAHDLNNPLGGISGYTQLLLEEETDPRKLDALSQVMGEVQRCNRIVGELLSFSRRRPVEQTDFDVAEVLQRTMRLRERQIQSSGLRCRIDVDEELPHLRGDPHQLQQVFLNILVNGEHALRQGGERIEVRAHRAAPASADAPGREWVVVTFFNDGPPIPPDVLPRIFEPFFTTKGEDEGTGLGLSICRRIVREHGGDIDAESGPDGTTFRVRLPVKR